NDDRSAVPDEGEARLAPTRSGLLEAGLLPCALVEDAPHAPDVPLRLGGVPAAGEPAAHATPGITSRVLAAALELVQPHLVTLVGGAPDGVCRVRVHGGRGPDSRPARLLEGIAVLDDAPALRAQAWPAVRAEAVPGRARAPVRPPFALVGLPP